MQSWPIDHIHVAEPVTLASHQRRKEAVQRIEIRKCQKDLTAERLEPASGIAGAVAQNRLARS